MLPSLRLIVATFFGGFLLAAAGVHFAGHSRSPYQPLSVPPGLTPGEARRAVSGTIDLQHAGTPVPVIFDLRFSADLTAIAAIPAQPATAIGTPAEPGDAAPTPAPNPPSTPQ